MKVLIITNESATGGAVLSLLDMVHNLRKYISVIVVVPEDNGFVSKLKDEGITYYVVPFLRDYVDVDNNDEIELKKIYCSNYIAAKKVAEIVRNEKATVIHTNSSVGNVGAMASVMTNVPHVWHIRELIEDHYNAKYIDYELKKLLFQSSTLISISEAVRKIIFQRYGIYSECIYNGLVLRNYPQSDFENDKDIHKLLLVGGITKNKGQIDAVKAVKILKDDGISDIELCLVGGGQSRAAWSINRYIRHNKLEDNIRMLEFTQDLRELRRKYGIALMTSKMEAMGRVTVEAMLSGEMVIGADSGGTTELIGNKEERGLLYKQGDPYDLARVLKKAFCLSKSEINDCLTSARQFALENFDSQNYVLKILDCYKKAMDKSNSMSFSELHEELEKKYINSIRVIDGDSEWKCGINGNGMMKKAWQETISQGVKFVDYFTQNNIDRVAIYGMGKWGCRLADELDIEGVKVAFVVDRDSDFLDEEFDVRTVNDNLDDADLMIVAISSNENGIIDFLKRRCNIRIQSLRELLCNMLD